MKRLIFLPMLCWAALLVAQEKYNAIILEDEESFVMSAPTSGTYNVRRTVRVFNDAGLDEAVFQEYTDQFRSLSSFKGTLERENGKPLKLKKDDLVMVSVASGLAEDGFVHGYQPSSTYPFTVTYEYTITYRKGVASFPTFFPVSSEKVKVEKASYTFQVPSGTKINCVTSKVGDVRKETGKADTYRWEVPVFEGYTAEAIYEEYKASERRYRAIDLYCPGITLTEDMISEYYQTQFLDPDRERYENDLDLYEQEILAQKLRVASCSTVTSSFRSEVMLLIPVPPLFTE